MIFLPCIVVIIVLPLLCFCLPCIVRILARLRDPMHGKGAAEEAINQLETVEFRETEGGAGKSENCCAICLSDYEPGEQLRVLPCGHRFHKACVDEWLRVNASCPTCRQHIVGDVRAEVQNPLSADASPANDNSASSGSEVATSGVSASGENETVVI